mmetsp:Transcript_6562/g.14512  ORF Transcript_6562/g.14512 Transcript_6562/m.14512 type:complete len:211 (-) Transcript_6562:2198-2830(-)
MQSSRPPRCGIGRKRIPPFIRIRQSPVHKRPDRRAIVAIFHQWIPILRRLFYLWVVEKLGTIDGFANVSARAEASSIWQCRNCFRTHAIAGYRIGNTAGPFHPIVVSIPIVNIGNIHIIGSEAPSSTIPCGVEEISAHTQFSRKHAPILIIHAGTTKQMLVCQMTMNPQRHLWSRGDHRRRGRSTTATPIGIASHCSSKEATQVIGIGPS